MAEEKVGLFEDNEGNYSWTRVMCFASLLMSFATAGFSLYKNLEDGLLYTALFLLAAFTPKTVQKFAEMKIK